MVFLPLLISDVNFAKVETVVKNEASGENASVKTEITNIVNQNVVEVESTSPGEIKVKVQDGEVEVESSAEASPTVVIRELDEEEAKEAEEEIIGQTENVKNQIFSFIAELFSNLSRFFHFRI